MEHIMYLRLLLKKHKKSSAVLYAIPHFFTLLNAFFGFLSIIKSLENECTTAAYFIVLAALMDGIDGRLARKFGSTSCFGTELDSLCDAVSFCLAPSILIYSWFPGNFTSLGIFILGCYVCAGILRLARFNVNSNKPPLSYFKGLPTTVAAFCIASLILYAPWLSLHSVAFLFSHKSLCLIVFTLSILMVSSIPFAGFKTYKITSLSDYFIFCFFVITFMGCIACHYPWLLFVIFGYMGYNLFRFFYHFLREII
jgi:CDP-diacylglycerol---serine O-phosphatidyltransferase